MGSVKKALIPAAGLGTRFLPVTKTVPKELLPIVDRPIILYVIEEAVRAGIEEIILVTRQGKESLEDFFKPTPRLADHLDKNGQQETLKMLKEIESMCRITPVRQDKPLGLGHAICCGEPAIGEEPFAVLLGDEIMWTPPEEIPVIGQLIQNWDKNRVSTVAVTPVEKSEVHKYGIIKHQRIEDFRYTVEFVVEKPVMEEAPSQLALPGRYIFHHHIFTCLRYGKPTKNGEIQLTDGMTLLAQSHGMEAIEVQGQRFDAGDQLGYLKANIEFGLKNPKIQKDLAYYLKSMA